MAKILMVNLPYAGHTNPTLGLARELIRRGHQVSYINGPEMGERIESTGARFIPFLEYPHNLGDQARKTRCFLAAYKTVMAVGRGFDLLIYEMLFFPGKTIADRLGIPCVRQFSQPAWNMEVFTDFEKSYRAFHFSAKLIGWQMMGKKTAKVMEMEGMKFIPTVLSDAPALNIAYLSDELQPHRETFGNSFLFAGPPITPPAPPRKEFLKWAKQRPPIIYISMGSIMSSKIFCKRCIKAFEHVEATIILSTGKIPPQALEPLPPHIHAYSSVPQLEVLEHADLFVTHGGMNSVNEALYFGVPMLLLPIVNDQPINAGQVEKIGAGKRMRAFPTTATILRRNALATLDNPALQEAVTGISRRLQSRNTAKIAADAVEELL